MAETGRERAWSYIQGAWRALKNAREELAGRHKSDLDYERLFDAVERYLRDAEYYYSRGDYETSIAAASYAEGLLDALKYLGIIEPRWPHRKELSRRIFLGGTFDIVHPGHIELFRAAAELGRPYVVIARDSTVRKLKGREPVLPEEARLSIVSSIRYVYDAMLGSERDFMKSVARVRPDIILLGPDQAFDEEELAARAEKVLGYRPEVRRLPEKVEFAPGFKGSRDIIAKICRGSYCGLLG